MKVANNCFQAAKGQVEQRWYIVDAKDKVLGRLATKIATVLMGKNKPTYTPFVDTGDFVVVLNADKAKVSGRKKDEIVYQKYTGYPGGLREFTMREMLDRNPEFVLRTVVRRMLPKNGLAKHMLGKLKLYTGTDHPHHAQHPEPLPL